MKKHISAVFKNIRLAHGLTQEQLAEMIDRSPGHVGMLEQGRAVPSYEVMEKLINIFELDANLFFGVNSRNAEVISADVIQTVQNMPTAVREMLRLYNQVVEQFSKDFNNSKASEDSNKPKE